MKNYLGPPDFAGDLRDAALVIEEAWELVGPAFGGLQVREYGWARENQRPPRHRLHPWVPGLYWHTLHRHSKYSGPLPPEVLSVLRDMHALKVIPDVLPAHRDEVVRRIKQGGERALSEVRVAAQYAPSGIRAEWTAVTRRTPGAPDVWIPAFNTSIEVKRLDRGAHDEDPSVVFARLDKALGQLRGSGPNAIFMAVPGPASLDAWKDHESVFYRCMNDRLNDPAYSVVSAMVFWTDPVVATALGQQFIGSPSYRIVNPLALQPWPAELPLSVA